MTLREIAEELVAGCREDRVEENLGKLYAVDAVSVEATPGPDGSRETHGLEGIRGKHAWWNSTFVVHDADVDGPFLHGDDRFAVVFEVEAENRETGERSEMEEVGVYHVRDGKIVREEFFYTT
jgi:ketosteroid isomerase-like protein